MSLLPAWFLVALLGHLANGTAFVIDKTLLRSAFKRPATYAGLIGILGTLALVLLPFGIHLPDPLGWLWAIVSGMTFIFSLWLFFIALSNGEASRVVPVIGSLIPILTLAGTATFLGERLSMMQLAGFGLLIIATLILSGGTVKSRLSRHTLILAVCAAATFAFSSVTAKFAYDTEGFLTTFVISRLAGVIAAVILLVMDDRAREELFAAIGFTKHKEHRKAKSHAVALVVTAQCLGALGFVAVQYATSLGSAALVNALQAVQYALLVLVAFAFHKRAPQLLGEDLTTETITRKVIAIAIVGAGLWLVV